MKKRRVGSFFAFAAMIIIVVSLLTAKLGGALGIDMAKVMNIMKTFEDVAILLALAIGGFEFTEGRKKTYLMMYLFTLIIWIVMMFF